ncbi:hypothetical protein RP726_00855 [Candidatus Methylospira mobilis]|nr:hypothetical protein [Candidatus Methylospira mobilis]WNV04978.1 hypothetical protein RP726_00855 [Candidatus Methylospira mobilis]
MNLNFSKHIAALGGAAFHTVITLMILPDMALLVFIAWLLFLRGGA